jgi:predicted dehydrogenase
VELACRVGVPVYCVPSLETDGERAGELARQVRAAGLKFMFEMRARLSPATRRLHRLLAARLGPPQVGQLTVLATRAELAADDTPRTLEWLDWCLHLMGELPVRVLATAVGDESAPALDSVLLEFAGARAVQVNFVAVAVEQAAALPAPRAEVVTARGTARVRFPARLCWTYRRAVHQERLPHSRPAEVGLLRQFHRLVTGHTVAVPGMDEAERALRVWYAAAESWAAGRWVEVAG